MIDMAKATIKKAPTTSKPKAAVARKPVAKATTSNVDKLEIACNLALNKLKSLNLEPQLQSDLEWCLGSFSSDKNPIGLYEMGQRALEVFKTELAKKTKGVTAKMVSDLEKAVKG
jgi:hypothetical protein